jgi:site-specific recombinase XerD
MEYRKKSMFSSGVRAKRGQMAIDHKDIKTTMIYVSLGKSHIREQVEKGSTDDFELDMESSL